MPGCAVLFAAHCQLIWPTDQAEGVEHWVAGFGRGCRGIGVAAHAVQGGGVQQWPVQLVYARTYALVRFKVQPHALLVACQPPTWVEQRVIAPRFSWLWPQELQPPRVAHIAPCCLPPLCAGIGVCGSRPGGDQLAM